jgi:hypothetical protein
MHTGQEAVGVMTHRLLVAALRADSKEGEAFQPRLKGSRSCSETTGEFPPFCAGEASL